jgi:hypothetical protein
LAFAGYMSGMIIIHDVVLINKFKYHGSKQRNELSQGTMGPKVPDLPKRDLLPGSMATLILGIAALENMSFLGWIPALIAYHHYKRAKEALETNPDRYSATSVSMAHSGKKMADIGLVLGLLGMVVTFIYFYLIFSNVFSHSFFPDYRIY